MLVAKHFPGKYDVPYVAGMNMSSAHTGILSSQFSIANMYDADTALSAPCGSKRYQIIAYCPVLTAMNGNAAFGTTTKLGGLTTMQTDDPNATIFTFTDFYSTTADEAYSMSDIYGSQGTSIANNAFIWASELSMILEAPRADVSGSVSYGHFPLSSLVARDSVAELTLNDMRKSVTGVHSFTESPTITLSCAVVNHEIVNRMGL